VSALDQLHRGPDRYARPELRAKVRELRFGPATIEMLRVLHPDAYWRDLALAIAEGLVEALDRLDDAERLLEEREP